MGWTFLHKEKKQKLADFFKQEFTYVTKGCEILDVASHLNVAYIALQLPTHEVTALVVLLRHVPTEYYNFGYKDMDETQGPNESNCPERILKLLTPTTSEYALAWRKRCYDNLSKRKNAAKVGDTIHLTESLTFTDGHKGDTFKIVQHSEHIYFQDVTTRGLYRITNWKTKEYSILTEV
jgi:hypothetical protein